MQTNAANEDFSSCRTGAVRIFHANTYSLENTLNYGMERIWAISCRKGSNRVALGFDEGSMMIKMGKEQPVVSMDSSGKIIWARHTEIQVWQASTLCSRSSDSSDAQSYRPATYL